MYIPCMKYPHDACSKHLFWSYRVNYSIRISNFIHSCVMLLFFFKTILFISRYPDLRRQKYQFNVTNHVENGQAQELIVFRFVKLRLKRSVALYAMPYVKREWRLYFCLSRCINILNYTLITHTSELFNTKISTCGASHIKLQTMNTNAWRKALIPIIKHHLRYEI